jgi:hypothetical protein
MKDLLFDTDGDLKIDNDDLVIGFSDQQQRESLLMLDKGALKQSPGVGVGLFKYLEAEEPSSLLREINIQFSADGMEVLKAGFDDFGNLIIEAPYKSNQ